MNEKQKQEYIGLTKVLEGGFKATIVEFYHRNCIEVILEKDEKAERFRMTMRNFEAGILKGSIWEFSSNNSIVREYWQQNSTPRRKENKEKYNESIIGLKNRMNNGMMAEIIGSRNSKDIDVQFEDGYIIKGTNVGQFKTGSIRNPNLKKKEN